MESVIRGEQEQVAALVKAWLDFASGLGSDPKYRNFLRQKIVEKPAMFSYGAYESPIAISTSEWLEFSHKPLDSAEFKKWSKEKGIKLNTGVVKINLDGQPRIMLTSAKDFGTCMFDEKWFSENQEGDN